MGRTQSQFAATDPAEYEHFMGRWSRRLAKPFLEFAGIRPSDQVLDVGCGTGVLMAALAEAGAEVVGIDASEPYLDGARRHRSHPNITYELGDVCRMGFADGFFDGCVSTLVLDIIPEADRVAPEGAPERPARRDPAARPSRISGWLAGWAAVVRHHRASGAGGGPGPHESRCSRLASGHCWMVRSCSSVLTRA
jgi:SAM-dependent methyltransferase